MNNIFTDYQKIKDIFNRIQASDCLSNQDKISYVKVLDNKINFQKNNSLDFNCLGKYKINGQDFFYWLSRESNIPYNRAEPMLLCSFNDTHSLRPVLKKDIEALAKQRYNDIADKWDMFSDKLTEPSSDIYFLIDNLLGKDYHKFRTYYEIITQHNSYRLRFGTFYELANEALNTLSHSEEKYWKNKIFKTALSNNKKGEEFCFAIVNNNGTYKDLIPLTNDTLDRLKDSIFIYLSDNRYQDKTHIIGRAKLIFYINDKQLLKEIARDGHLDYHLLLQIEDCKKNIKDLSANAISYLNNYYLQLNFCKKLNSYHK